MCVYCFPKIVSEMTKKNVLCLPLLEVRPTENTRFPYSSIYLIRKKTLAQHCSVGPQVDILVCCRSSVIRDSRNPLWGEDFSFSVHELPVQVAYYHLC